jgi:hypothetical protein
MHSLAPQNPSSALAGAVNNTMPKPANTAASAVIIMLLMGIPPSLPASTVLTDE